jgi:hypothetical protein
LFQAESNVQSVVDGNLFALSHEKKWIGLLLLPMFLKLVGSSSRAVSTLFDGNCWKCLVNNLSNHANYLHVAAKTALEACVELTRYAGTIRSDLLMITSRVSSLY